MHTKRAKFLYHMLSWLKGKLKWFFLGSVALAVIAVFSLPSNDTSHGTPSFGGVSTKYYLGPWVQDITVTDHLKWIPPEGTTFSLDLRSIPAHQTPGVALFASNTLLGPDYLLIGEGEIDQITPNEAIRILFAQKLNLPTVSGTTLQEWVWDVLTLRADPMGINGPKPLMPTRDIKLELHAGKIKQKDFELAMPEAAPVIAVLQEDYRAIRADAKAGRMMGTDGVDTEFHRRVLDSWGEKFRVADPENYFIPADLPKEEPLKHSTSYSESFNKADAATLGPDLTWSEPTQGDAGGTSWKVVSNTANVSDAGDSHARADHNTSSSDMFAQFTYDTLTVSGGIISTGVDVRFSATAVTNYMWQARTDTSTCGWGKWVDGIETFPIGSNISSCPTAAGDVLRGEVSGSTLTGKINGVSKSAPTDTAITGNTRGGLRGIITGSSVTRVDSFSFGDLVEAAVTNADTDPIWFE